MIERPFVTVMVLCYNCATFVNTALEAIAAQTYKHFELLFIDNGSTDDSRKVFDSFCSKHHDLLIRVISVEKNEGPTHGWNEGLRAAHGEYVLFNDADDWMEPDCLELLVQKAEKTGADRVTGQYREITTQKLIIRDRVIVSEKTKKLPTAMLQGTIFRRKVFEDNHILFPEKENRIAYDFEIVYRFAACEKKSGEIIQKTIYNYLVHTDSTIQKTIDGSTIEKSFEIVTKPLLLMASSVIKTCEDKDLCNRMEYLIIRNYYPKVISIYQNADYKTATDIYSRMHKLVLECFPHYTSNSLLKPFNNGYEQPGSFAVWFLCVVERLGLFPVSGRFIANRMKGTIFFR